MSCSYCIICKVAVLVSNSIAILCTIARLVYRAWTRYFWWEDAWAAVALIADGEFFCALPCSVDQPHLPSSLPGVSLARPKNNL